MICVVSFGLLILNSNNNSLPTILHYSIANGAQQYNNNNSLVITHGIASGDITDDSAVIWSRVNREAKMHVEYDIDTNFSHPKSANITTLTNQTTDYTAHVKLEGLSHNTLYYYRVWFTAQDQGSKNNNNGGTGSIVSDSVTGTFRTSPQHSTSKTVSFVIGGDLGGQKYCKRIDMGYPIFSIMKALSPDFFIFNGDQIYGDDVCPAHHGPEDVVGWYNIQGNFPSVMDKEINWANLSQLQDIYNKHWDTIDQIDIYRVYWKIHHSILKPMIMK